MRNSELDRRNFLKGVAAAGTASMSTPPKASAQAPSPASPAGEVPRKPLGKTGLQVSALGVGGFHLGSAKDQAEVNQIVSEALDAGINFFDNAWDYHEAIVKSAWALHSRENGTKLF